MNAPAKIASDYLEIAKKKVSLPVYKMLLLGFMAGFFIALAAVGANTVSCTVENASVAKLLGACVFPAGLAMVVVAGSELFTGNCLLVIPALQREISIVRLLKSWLFVYIGNLIGAMTCALLVVCSHQLDLFSSALAQSTVNVAAAKAGLSAGDAFLRGILCNFLVCIAVWMGFAAKSAAGKILGIYFPIMLFVLCGFEHSVADMYYIPAGLFAAQSGSYSELSVPDALTWLNYARSLLFITLGNIVGGGFVGLVYWLAYLKAPAAKK